MQISYYVLNMIIKILTKIVELVEARWLVGVSAAGAARQVLM